MHMMMIMVKDFKAWCDLCTALSNRNKYPFTDQRGASVTRKTEWSWHEEDRSQSSSTPPRVETADFRIGLCFGVMGYRVVGLGRAQHEHPKPVATLQMLRRVLARSPPQMQRSSCRPRCRRRRRRRRRDRVALVVVEA